MSGPRYDVFLSYHSKAPTGYWVREFFVAELQGWLDNQFPDGPVSIFYDRTSIDVGEDISDKLLAALAASHVFVPVLSPSYFSQSKWCAWEWQCFRSLRPDAVMPVLFYNRAALPAEAQGLNMEDFSDVNSAFPGFPKTERYGDFQNRVREFAQKIAARLPKLPPPEGLPPDFEPPPVPRPRGVPRIDQRRMAA